MMVKKNILRKAFDTPETHICQRSFMETKEQFLMEWDTIGLMIEYCFSSNG
jgi:hypothetical protein